MITVYIPDQFIPERTYAVTTLMTHYCGVEVTVIPVADSLQYALRWQDQSIILHDGFFSKISPDTPYASSVHLPERIVQTTTIGLEGILMLYGIEQIQATPQKIETHVDLFAGIFFMLTRWEESIGGDKDLHGRFPASRALLVKEGYILRPVVDEYAALMRSWLLAIGYPVPEPTSQYKVLPTCDVDMPYFWRTRSLWKTLGGKFKKHFNPLQTFRDYKQYKSVLAGSTTDPYDRYDYFMDLAESADLRFQFNFIGGGTTRYEGHYDIADPLIRALLQKIITRGHSVGLHPSYDAFDTPEMILKEKLSVEKNAEVLLTSSRQHYLRFIVPDTWRHLEAAGITDDSTLGYAAEPGFRCGTCKPFPVFDIQQRKTLNLTEHPLLIMDVSLRMYKNLSIEQSIALCQKIRDQVIKHQGELVFLWHNSSLSEIDDWAGWERVPEYLLQKHSSE